MDALTITHVRTPTKSPQHLEARLRVLHSALIPPLYLAGELGLHGIEHRLCHLIAECDRLLEELDL